MDDPILIIDDDEELCMELKEILAEEGYEVYVALDGYKGQELMARRKYRVVILDLKLPKMNGYEVLKTAKSSPDAPHIIILSGRPMGRAAEEYNDQQSEEEKILQLADAVLNKPIPIPLLLSEIKKHI